jgi:hypothetical protein
LLKPPKSSSAFICGSKGTTGDHSMHVTLQHEPNSVTSTRMPQQHRQH